jgi:peptidoglycan LD-endopeptidase CwlK
MLFQKNSLNLNRKSFSTAKKLVCLSAVTIALIVGMMTSPVRAHDESASEPSNFPTEIEMTEMGLNELQPEVEEVQTPTHSRASTPATPWQIVCLQKAYPNAFTVSSDKRYLVFPDGTRFLFNDGMSKTPYQKLVNPDIEDMFAYPYPKGRLASPPTNGLDPGGSHHIGFFKKLYGSTEGAARANLVIVPKWSSAVKYNLYMNKRYGAAAALTKVSADLRALIASKPSLAPYVTGELGGTFNWRYVTGTTTLSNHSFGTAVDLNVKYTNFWVWDMKLSGHLNYRNQIPYDIVQIFENHGFIWGGKWTYYDTMHFEFRPEMLMSKAQCGG